MNQRIKIYFAFVIACFLFIIFGLFWIQIINGAYYRKKAENNRIILIPLEAPRGKIYDRNGIIIVDNRISFDLSIIYKDARDAADLMKFLLKTLDISLETLKTTFEKAKWHPYVPISIVEDIGKEKAVFLEENSLDYPGLSISTRPKRSYIYGKYGSSVIGYLGKIKEDELSKYKTYGYTLKDYIGRAGIEKEYDHYLRGSQGGMQVETDASGKRKDIISIQQPVKGKDIYLTIDIELQKFCDRVMGDRNGAVIVMDPKTGEVFSLVSRPNYDPNIFIRRESKAQKLVVDLLLNVNNDYPLINRAISAAYAPGSIFKIVVAIAAMSEKKISADTPFLCKGYFLLGRARFNCWKKTGHDSQTLSNALKNSCNVYFYQVGLRTGVGLIVKYCQKFKFGKKTGIDLPCEISGNLPSPSWKRKRFKEAWYAGDTVNFSIGQGFLLVTPIQLIRMVAAVANDGVLTKPFVLDKIEDIHFSESVTEDLRINKNTINVVKEGLEKVVNDEHGTGIMAKVEGVKIAGKTGTAQNQTENDHGWFCGFGPVENPDVVVLVFVEYGGKGGYEASKIAKLVFEKCIDVGLLGVTGKINQV